MNLMPEPKIARQRRKIDRYKDDSSNSTSSSASSPEFDAACLDIMRSSNGTMSMFSHCSQEDAVRNRASLNRFAEQALKTYMKGDPCTDHHLKLIQFNIINGFTKNAAMLGYKHDWLICAAVSPFGRNGPCYDDAPTTVPDSLVPTSLQLSTTHHPWLDLFPFPKLRDNLLVALSFLSVEEEQQLFEDIMESSGNKSEWTGLVVWGEPWDPQSWELSVPFMERWAWLINGCPEIISSTNHWRRKRGEGPIAPPPGMVVEEFWEAALKDQTTYVTHEV